MASKKPNCMLAHELQIKRIAQWPVIMEPKYDGVRVTAKIQGSNVTFHTRFDRQVATMNKLIEPVVRLVDHFPRELLGGMGPTLYLDGEVVGKGYEDFDETSGQIRMLSGDIGEDKIFRVFDPRGPLPYLQRRELLDMAFRKGFGPGGVGRVMIPPCLSAKNEDEIYRNYTSFREMGHEGAIVKLPEGIYESGKRSYAWMKMKEVNTDDVQIEGAIEGEGKYIGMLGALTCRRKNGTVVSCAGMDDAQRKEWWEWYQHDLKLACEVPDVRFKLIGRWCEVFYQDETASGSLRQLRFSRFRDDLNG